MARTDIISGKKVNLFYFSRYWKYDDEVENWKSDTRSLLLSSDGMMRADLISLKMPNNYKEAQKQHENLRNIEKNDSKMRDYFTKK